MKSEDIASIWRVKGAMVMARHPWTSFSVNSLLKMMKSSQFHQYLNQEKYLLRLLICLQKKEIAPQRIEPKGQKFHKLDQTYPHAPVPEEVGGMVLHNSHLHDISGVSTLFDWLSDGDAAIVELGTMISREAEFNAAIDQLSQFVIDDIGGKILQISDSRILLLPPGCSGISGLMDEAFVTDNEFKTL